MATATSDNDTRLPGLPRYIRINTLKTSRSEAAKSLTATGHVPEQPSTYRAARKGDAPAESSNRSYVPDAHVPDLLVFKPKGQSDISRIPLVASGALVVQQKASCFPAVALAPPPGAHVIDGCAAPGNKTCHIAALMGGRGTVVAFEQDARRHQLLKEQMALKGATTVTTVHGSFLDADPQDYAHVTHILRDPSCSSSGMSTSPVRDPAGIAALAAAQKTLLLHAMTFPSVRAIVYSTCSVYDEENEMVVRDVLRAQSRFVLEEALPFWPRRGHTAHPQRKIGVACPSLEKKQIFFDVFRRFGFFRYFQRFLDIFHCFRAFWDVFGGPILGDQSGRKGFTRSVALVFSFSEAFLCSARLILERSHAPRR